MGKVILNILLCLDFTEGFSGLDDGGIEISRILEVSGVVVIVVNVSKTESNAITISPFEVIHSGPDEVSSHVNLISDLSFNHIGNVVLQIVDSEGILNSKFSGDNAFIGARGTIFENIKRRISVSLGDPVDDLSHTLRIDIEPAVTSERTNLVSIDISDTFSQSVVIGIISADFTSMLDISSGIMVKTEEIERSLHHLSLSISESGKSVASDVFSHNIGVFTEDNRVSKPAILEGKVSINSLDIIGIVGIERFSIARVNGDTDLASLSGLVFSSVGLDGNTVAKKSMVSSNIRLSGRVTTTTDFLTESLVARAASAGSLATTSVATPSEFLDFVKSDPVFNSITESLETEVSIVVELVDDIRVQPASSFSLVIQSSRKIPMVKSDPRLDSVSQEKVEDIVVEINTFLVDEVNGAVREDSGPSNRHSEMLDFKFSHSSNIVLEVVIEIISNLTGLIVIDKVGVRGIDIPNVETFTVNVPSAFDLVGSSGSTPDEIAGSGNLGSIKGENKSPNEEAKL